MKKVKQSKWLTINKFEVGEEWFNELSECVNKGDKENIDKARQMLKDKGYDTGFQEIVLVNL